MYRNNLVRTTLSIFAACTLLYTASASAQSSTQLNSPVLTPEFSDAPVATSLGPLLSENITGDESYTPEVITMRQATATEEAPTMTLAQAEPELPQLDTPTGFSAAIVPIGDDLIFIGWNYIGSSLSIVEKYKVNLYLGTDTNGEVLHAEEHTRVRVNNPSNAAVFLMFAYTPLTQYTIELIVQATGHEDSNPLTETVMTRKFSLYSPTRSQLVIAESTYSVTVTFEDTQIGVDGYALRIRKRFDDMEIARNEEDFLIAASSVTFNDLLPGREYTLEAMLLFNDLLYTGANSFSPLNFETVAAPLPSTTMLTAVFEVRRENTFTVSDIRVAWDSVEGAQSYTVRLYTTSGNEVAPHKTVRAPTTGTVFDSPLYNGFLNAGVTAMSDGVIYSESEEAFAPVLPPKLSSEFFTVTPSHNSLSLFWDSSYDAGLEDGVYFYDATYIGNLGSSVSSILLISIEDDEGNRITGPAQVSTEADTYSIGGLSDETNYVLKIVQRVRFSDGSPESEALEIPFRTKQELPEPTGTQIRSAVDGTTLTVDWDNVAPGVTNYDLSLITREGTTIGTPKEVNALVAGSTTFTSLNAETNYILGVVAKGDTNLYSPSPQYFVAVLSPKLPSDLFNLNEGSNSLRLNWNGEEITNFDNETKTADYLFFSIVDMDGNLVGNESMASTRTQTHDFSGLEQTTEYKLKIVLGVLVKDFIGTQSLLKSEALEIPFRTLEELPEPTKIQISWARGETTLTVSWDDVPTNVTSYEISLATAEGAVIGIPKEVSALMAGSTTFTSLDAETTYTLSVVAKGDPSVYAPSPPYHISVQPQLDTPVIADTTVVRNIITIFWSSAQMENVEKYRLNLYLGNDTSGQASRSEEIGNDSNSLTLVFAGLEALEQYTVELIAQAVGYRDSNPVTRTLMTEIGLLDPLTANELRITESADNIRVNFQNTQVGVDGYSLSIQKRFGDRGVAKSQENFTIADSPVTFTDLLPSRAYTLMAEPTFNSERYEYTGGIVSLDFMTLDTPLLLPLRLRVFLEGPLQ